MDVNELAKQPADVIETVAGLLGTIQGLKKELEVRSSRFEQMTLEDANTIHNLNNEIDNLKRLLDHQKEQIGSSKP